MCLILLSACDHFNTELTKKDVTYYQASQIQTPNKKDTLMIMTWNLKFGGGRIDFFFDCIGNRVIMKKEEVINNLKKIAHFIAQTNPDILMVQEIDTDSKRTAFVDQVQWLLDNTPFNYAVYAPQWKASHIPSNGLGRMNSGLAIFSQHPLSKTQRIALPLIEEQKAIVRYFYLKRCLLDCEVNINGETIRLLTTHAEAYSNDSTKKKQLDVICQYLQPIHQTFILAGDFNSLPPGTIKTKGFPDSFCTNGDYEADDYSQETNWMRLFYDQYSSAISINDYVKNNTAYFTHTVDSRGFWNRKLDYIFSNQHFIPGSDVTWQSKDNGGLETMTLSDHCPISIKINTISFSK
jgi:endonuclease/exonuclease/phosphatase family metal-dependent hydrolase